MLMKILFFWDWTKRQWGFMYRKTFRRDVMSAPSRFERSDIRAILGISNPLKRRRNETSGIDPSARGATSH
jgi:hypothetical protein